MRCYAVVDTNVIQVFLDCMGLKGMGDVKRIPEALAAGCGADAPGSFAVWLSRQVVMHAFVMPGRRYDVGDVESYRRGC